MRLQTHVIAVRRYDGTAVVVGLAKGPVTLHEDEFLIEIEVELAADLLTVLAELPRERRRIRLAGSLGPEAM
jgi:hypothetical protein